MTPELKFFLNLAWFFLAVAGICFMALSLPEIIEDIKSIYKRWTKEPCTPRGTGRSIPLLSYKSKKGDEKE